MKKVLVIKHESAFTLVEISIVIVIIALIVSAVTAGASLVRQSHLKKVITDLHNFEVAYNSFKLQYSGIAGDLINADSFWPGCGTGATSAQCNGDGNKHIDNSTTANDNETLRFWQHLGLSKLIPGTYTGIGAGTNGNACTPGVNVPSMSLASDGCYFMEWKTNWTGPISSMPGVNLIRVAGDVPNATPFGTLFYVSEIYGIDSKFDDGNPYKGQILGAHDSSCTTGATIALGAYVLTYTGKCMMGYRVYN